MVHLILIVGAIVSFAVAVLISTSVFDSGNAFAWLAGGLLSFALSLIDFDAIILARRPPVNR
jgi:hypothetical protein